MPSSMHWFLAASSETGATVGLAVVATFPAGVSVKVSVVMVPVGLTWRVWVTPAGETLVCVTPGGPPAGFVVVCVVA